MDSKAQSDSGQIDTKCGIVAGYFGCNRHVHLDLEIRCDKCGREEKKFCFNDSVYRFYKKSSLHVGNSDGVVQ
jgi:hypothetical protein